MTVEELHDVLTDKLDGMEEGRKERHAELVGRLDKINGRVGRHDDEISGLKVRDAFWAGGLAALAALLKFWR